MKLAMGSCEPLFLQMQPNLVPSLEVVWNSMLVMSLLVFSSIVLFQTVMDLLEYVLDSFNKYGGLIILKLIMGRFLLCGCKVHSYIIWGQWLETQAHLKMVVTDKAMKSYVIFMLNIRKVLIRCVWMFRIVDFQNMHNHPVDYLLLSISLGMEGS